MNSVLELVITFSSSSVSIHVSSSKAFLLF
jgi:hypothetical protein